MSFTLSLTRFFSILAFLFLVGITLAAILEDQGVGRQWIAYFFIFSTLAAYALIGLLSRTSNFEEYYVAGREVPAVYNGMATAADWMSAASFLGVAGTLYYSGYGALALIVGWTGGFVLIALLVAPYLRKFYLYSVGDFLAMRYPGNDNGHWVRLASVVVTLSISFVYVVAQIYAVGLITSRFAGVEFGIGVFFGLAGILVCSFLGGMRAVTWTQVAQYIVMIVAMGVTVGSLWGVAKQGQERLGLSAALGLSQYIQVREAGIALDSKEAQVREQYRQEVERYQSLINNLPSSWAQGYEARRAELERLRYDKNATFMDIKEAERALYNYPQNAKEAKQLWSARVAGFEDRARASEPHFGVNYLLGDWLTTRNSLEFIATVFTLMCGTVALPHIIMRFMTTP
ncbi:MAG: cation acetate symporter, partial [Limnobacter sp.]|nr:cation acetate symporter [Limnobacter sp.]